MKGLFSFAVFALAVVFLVFSAIAFASSPIVSSRLIEVNGTDAVEVTVYHDNQNVTHYLRLIGYHIASGGGSDFLLPLNFSSWTLHEKLSSGIVFGRSGSNSTISFNISVPRNTESISLFTKCSISGVSSPVIVYGSVQQQNRTQIPSLNSSFSLVLSGETLSSGEVRLRLSVSHADWQGIERAEVYSGDRLVATTFTSSKEYLFDVPAGVGGVMRARVYCMEHGWSDFATYVLKEVASPSPLFPAVPSPKPGEVQWFGVSQSTWVLIGVVALLVALLLAFKRLRQRVV